MYDRDIGMIIKSCHTKNGVFKANRWVESFHRGDQVLTFAGVNSHHQNGMSERRIRELQELIRIMLIHASRRWPKAVIANICPYSLSMDNKVMNETPIFQNLDKKIPQVAFL